ncbi:uncharacterized protein LOC116451700 [Corvus moneduloides]|uniref:uncharacterized protein LOC116451700 n=1 Tax=Corvus moneduloides TaxID=1196302 RepID=UPI0013640E52|nr:uncharacterized protein LOC116451700 [Corvus moneduloides]
MSRTRAAASSLAFACLLHFQRVSGSRGAAEEGLAQSWGAEPRGAPTAGTNFPPPAEGEGEAGAERAAGPPPAPKARQTASPAPHPSPPRPDPSPAAAAPGQLRASSPTVAVPGGARLEGARSGFSRALIFHRLCLCLPVPVGKGTAGPNRSPHLAPYGEPSGKQDPGATGRPKEAGGGGAGGVCRAGKRILSLGAQRDPRGTCRARGVSVREGGLAGAGRWKDRSAWGTRGLTGEIGTAPGAPARSETPRLPARSFPPFFSSAWHHARGGWSNEGCRDSIPTGSPCPWALLCKVLELLSTLLFLCSGAGRNFVPDPRGTKDSQAPQCIMIKWEDWAREEGF